jgi:hypothetical protein
MSGFGPGGQVAERLRGKKRAGRPAFRLFNPLRAYG